MSRFRPKLSFANVIACIALFISLGGAAYAAGITGQDIKNHSITGKDIEKGSLPLTVFKKTPVGEQGKTGPAGPAGPAGAPGAAGSALAFAHVNADGSLDAANSKNIAATKLTAQPGYYCVTPSVPFRNVIAGGYGGIVGRFYQASLEDPFTSCPDGAATVEVLSQSGKFTNSAFYILFN